ncbi:MAG: anthranilate phosphoribosyltransferase [Candidatus Omnitrophota bacterium]
MDIRSKIKKVVKKKDLSGAEMEQVFECIMTGHITPSQIASFLTALRLKGETAEEITAAARVMRRKSVKIKVREKNVIDTCGTGGVGKDTFNFSTASAFVAAGCGVKVAKHGNRSASGKCGSADVLEELGVRLEVTPSLTAKCIDDIGIGFLYAPIFHLSMKYAIGPRKEIGIRTIFNLLGPLCNPAFPKYQVVAVYDAGLTALIAEVLRNLGTSRAFVVHGEDGIDEVTITGKTLISELSEGKIKTCRVDPSDFGFKKRASKSIAGGSPKTNAGIMRAVLSGERGPIRDMTLMNSAVALVAARETNVFREAVKMAEESIDSGKALEKLRLLCEMTRGGTGKKKGRK